MDLASAAILTLGGRYTTAVHREIERSCYSGQPAVRTSAGKTAVDRRGYTKSCTISLEVLEAYASSFQVPGSSTRVEYRT